MSGIGADPASSSPYIAARGRGEAAVRAAFDDAVIVRPCVLCGPEDGFLTMLRGYVTRFPAMPLFGSGETRLQPVAVDDVAAAIAALVTQTAAGASLYEFGGPEVFAYRELLRRIAEHASARCLLVPAPFPLWSGAAAVAERLPTPPLYRGQVDLMRADNVTSGAYPGLDALGVPATPVERLLDRIAG
jgi:uncharacterized protein YbjT (DUF2867 family)